MITRGRGDDVLDELGDGFIALGGDGVAGAGGDFLDVGEVFTYLRTELGSAGSLVARQTTGRVSSMRRWGCASSCRWREADAVDWVPARGLKSAEEMRAGRRRVRMRVEADGPDR
jgi:hypothetical protein